MEAASPTGWPHGDNGGMQQPEQGNGGRSQFPPEVKNVIMMYASPISKKVRKHALPEIYTVE